MHGIDDNVDFAERLGQAVAWCVPHAGLHKPRLSLRSEEFHPNCFLEDNALMVREVLTSRGHRLDLGDWRPARSPAHLLGGRLMVFFPDANLVDGAAEVASNGYFDLNNIPPWDTWVGFYRSDSSDISERLYLVAYVPRVMLGLVQAGIDANPELCINWLYDVGTPIGDRLRSDGWQF